MQPRSKRRPAATPCATPSCESSARRPPKSASMPRRGRRARSGARSTRWSSDLMEAVVVRARSGSLALVRAVPVWAWLTAIVILSATLRFLLARRIVAPWIMVDELIYADLARGFAATGHFLIRGQSTAAYGFVYPLLIAPAFRVFPAMPTAYEAAKAINSVLMSLAAVPSYLLA